MFELFKEILNQMAHFVENFVIVSGFIVVGFWRDHLLDFSDLQPVIRVVCPIRDPHPGLYVVKQN